MTLAIAWSHDPGDPRGGWSHEGGDSQAPKNQLSLAHGQCDHAIQLVNRAESPEGAL